MGVISSSGTSNAIHDNRSHLLLFGKRKIQSFKISCE